MKGLPIALLGLGNVGREFARSLDGSRAGSGIRVRIAADSSGWISLRSAQSLRALVKAKEQGTRIREAHPRGARSMNEFSVALRRAGIRVLVESLPTRIETAWPALDYLREALLAGVHAVTVNKSPLAYGHSQLVRAARRGRAKLAYTGTTGVRAPRLEPGERLLRIEGSLNGTSNYVLDLMQAHGIPFIRAVAMAQEAGIAEPEPDLDLEGWDTAFKLLILSRDLLGGPRTMGEIRRTGISPGIESLIRSASRTGKVVRLVGRAERSEGRVRASVAPCPVGPRSPLFDLPGASKRAVFTTSSGRKLVGVGRSGRREIAQVILADVLEVAGVGGRA